MFLVITIYLVCSFVTCMKFPSTLLGNFKEPNQKNESFIIQRNDLKENKFEKKVLVLDVDGTLYHSKRGASDDLETQIRDNGYEYFKKYLSSSSEQTEELYQKFGSILPGLTSSNSFSSFFEKVYGNLCYESLSKYSYTKRYLNGLLDGYRC